jgi:hypothetical protein
MKYSLIIMLGIFFTLGSCKEKSDVDTTVTTESKTEETAPVLVAVEKQCFLNVIGRDSVMLQMERKGDSVTGSFNWKPFEKDSKRNNFKGIIKGNAATTLAAVSAEGMTSVEEFNFTIQDNKVSVQFGEMTEGKNGVWKYKEGTTSTEVLTKTDCK